ncbi:MAG TPA: protein kinase [Phycisphaerales bacterium]|nr:protein kinase [Phycisphaerales bacterium]
MSDVQKIRQLLEELMESEKTPEEVCRDDPSLLPELRVRWQALRAVDSQVERLFPAPRPVEGGAGPERRRRVIVPAGELPEIPGFEIQGTLGCGGMGIVYRARHLTLNRVVAIKMLIAGVYASPIELERFKREAESIAGLCHPNIVQVFDAGEWEGRPYFVMEFMEGGTLAAQLAGIPRPAKVAARDVHTLAGAMQLAHSAGVVHRDLKPANILLTADGTLKIADFGIARRSESTADGAMLTLTGSRLGTPSYMAPEQAAGARGAFGPAVDIYALGAILYEMLTGRPPFRGDTPAETERQVINDEPVAPMRLNPRTPRDLQTICLKALQKDPGRRYATPRELAEDLDRFLRCVPILARPVGRIERAYKWTRRRPAAAALTVTILVLAVATIILGGWIQRVESARRTELLIRQEGARNAIVSSLTLTRQLVRDGRWTEAQNILEHATERVAEADSRELAREIGLVSSDLSTARELDRIRHSYPRPDTSGYDYRTAAIDYQAVFTALGAGEAATPQSAARALADSAIRNEIVIALDNAAFVSFVAHSGLSVEHLLTTAKLLDPDPWRDDFRTAAWWNDRSRLEGLLTRAREDGFTAPPHQLVILSVLLSGMDAQSDAMLLLREAQARNPRDFWVNLELGNALNRMGEWSRAVQFFRAATAINPSNYLVWLTMGGAMLSDGDLDGSINALEKAVTIEDGFEGSWKLLMIAYGESLQEEKLAETIRRAKLAVPGDENVPRLGARLLGRMAMARCAWQSAYEQIDASLGSADELDGEIWFERAALAVLTGEVASFQQARAHMLDRARDGSMRRFLAARAVALAPAPPELIERATSIFEPELQGSIHQHWTLSLQAGLAYRRGDFPSAIACLEESNSRSPLPGHQLINWCWLALVHARLGELTDARSWLDKARAWTTERVSKRPTFEGVIHPHDWLEAHIIMQEASDVLLKTQNSAGVPGTP